MELKDKILIFKRLLNGYSACAYNNLRIAQDDEEQDSINFFEGQIELIDDVYNSFAILFADE